MDQKPLVDGRFVQATMQRRIHQMARPAVGIGDRVGGIGFTRRDALVLDVLREKQAGFARRAFAPLRSEETRCRDKRCAWIADQVIPVDDARQAPGSFR